MLNVECSFLLKNISQKHFKRVIFTYAGGRPNVGIVARVFKAWPATYINESQNTVLKSKFIY